MDTSLQNTHIIENQLTHPGPTEAEEAELESEEESHIHLPGPSYWPIILSVAILVTIAGFLAINSTPLIVAVGAVFVLVGILGWGLEDPMGDEHAKKEALSPEVVLRNAEDTVDQIVTVSSTAWSAHPVKVFVEREEPEGVVLSLYGKVELEAQKQEVEEALRNLPGVIDVMNFLVAEDELLNEVNALLERLKAAGKLDGAKNLSVLVENYIVSLYGEVPTPQMKYMLEREITGIPGARVVINHIGLNEDIPGNLGKTTNRIARI